MGLHPLAAGLKEPIRNEVPGFPAGQIVRCSMLAPARSPPTLICIPTRIPVYEVLDTRQVPPCLSVKHLLFSTSSISLPQRQVPPCPLYLNDKFLLCLKVRYVYTSTSNIFFTSTSNISYLNVKYFLTSTSSIPYLNARTATGV